MMALANTRPITAAYIHHVFMHTCTPFLKYVYYLKAGRRKKSMKGNIPIGFSLCHRPISASPMHRSCAQRRANDLLTSTRGQRIDGHSCCVGGLPGAQITDGMRQEKREVMENWTRRDDGDASRNKHSGRFSFGSLEAFTGFGCLWWFEVYVGSLFW